MKAKMPFGYVMDPRNNKKNPLDTTQTAFSKNNNYQRVNIVESKKMSLLKMHLFRGISPKCFLTPQKKTGCDIFKMAIF